MHLPQFHLHQRKANEIVIDHEGSGYVSLDDAIGDAAEAAREMMAARIREGTLPAGSEFHITNEVGKTVAVVKFEDVLAGKPFPPAPPIGREDW